MRIPDRGKGIKESGSACKDNHRIDSQLLIPGRGQPIENATVIIKAGKIAFAGETSDVPSTFLALDLPTTKVKIIMPGMWDCHVHYIGAKMINIGELSETNPAAAGARTARDLAATLDAGFTSVRELAGWGIDVREAVSDGWLAGPTVYSAGSMITMTGGHSDPRTADVCTIHGRVNHPLKLCDGVSDCIRAVREQVRRGANTIKIATGGGAASSDDLFAQHFSDEELKAIVSEAKRNRLSVAAHCHGPEAIRAALRAGVQSIEHGSYLDAGMIDTMIENNVTLVATRSVIEWAVEHPEAWKRENWLKIVEINEANLHSYKQAIKAGVRVALGTDIGISTPAFSFTHGTNGTEFKYAVDAGLTPLQAIEAGTANAAEVLGEQAPDSGQLKTGYDADIIALSDSPLKDISILAKPDCVTHVWKRGKLLKQPGKPVQLF